MIQDFENKLLHRNHGKAMPVYLLFLDIETEAAETGEGEEHSFKLGWTCALRRLKSGEITRESWLYWQSPEALCRYIHELVHSKTTLYLFAHNAFFDLQAGGFFQFMPGLGWNLSFVHEQGLTYILSIQRGTRRITVLSTTNFFQCSLKKLGEMTGLEKMEVDFGATSDRELSVYCRRDVEIIRAAMLRYFDWLVEAGLGRFSMTIPSQAMHAYRHRFMAAKISIHNYPPVSELERSGYYGGRVECGFIGNVPDGPFLHLDVNSMYPYVMTRYQLPTRLVDLRDDLTVDHLDSLLSKFHAVAHVRLSTDQALYALRSNGKVIFPVGDFDTYLNTFMMKEAIARGHLKEIYLAAFYERAYLFNEYVDFFYTERLRHKREKDAVLDYMCKLFMNSLYGKFGQKKPITEIVDSEDDRGYFREEILDLETGETILVYKLFNKEVQVSGWKEHKASMVAIASHITEAARLELWNIIERIGADRLLYCDTDCVIIREKDLAPLKGSLHNTELGALKIEEVYNELSLLGLKHYRTESKFKCKGVPKNAERLSDDHFRYTSFLKQASHMRREIADRIIARRVDKRLSLTYDKGEVTHQGATRPFRLGSPHWSLSPPP